MTRRDVAIVGVAESDLGMTNLPKRKLAAQASARALTDAGLGLGDVDGLFVNDQSRFSATMFAEELGISPTWTDSTFAGGAVYEMYVGKAAEAIAAGRLETALITYGNDQRSASRRTLTNLGEPDAPKTQFESPYAPLNPISMYAMAAQRHMHEFGSTEQDLAQIAIAAREWALLNPKAFRYGAGSLTVDDVMSSKPLSSPIKAADCCLVSDGGGAVVMTSLERARDLVETPVRVLGHGECTTHDSMAGMPDLTWTGAAVSGKRAFAMAGLTPDDVDVLQLYDSFTITVALTLEALGFCERGEYPALVADGRIGPGGDLPLNTSGGGLSYNHPGQFGVLLLVEAVRQLRHQAGDRQVAGAQVAVAHGSGGILSTQSTVLLGRDR